MNNWHDDQLIVPDLKHLKLVSQLIIFLKPNTQYSTIYNMCIFCQTSLHRICFALKLSKNQASWKMLNLVPIFPTRADVMLVDVDEIRLKPIHNGSQCIKPL